MLMRGGGWCKYVEPGNQKSVALRRGNFSELHERFELSHGRTSCPLYPPKPSRISARNLLLERLVCECYQDMQRIIEPYCDGERREFRSGMLKDLAAI